MAEIEIEKKKTVWPWILLGVLVLAAIGYFIWANSDKDDEIQQTETVPHVEQPVQITALVAYTAYIGNTGKMGLDHEYSNGALLYLIDAVQEKASEKQVDLSADLDQARSAANKITEDPESLTHANKIKEAGTIITRSMATLQKEHYPELDNEMNAVRNALNGIAVATPTLDQKEQVNSFFTTSEDLLTKMK